MQDKLVVRHGQRIPQLRPLFSKFLYILISCDIAVIGLVLNEVWRQLVSYMYLYSIILHKKTQTRKNKTRLIYSKGHNSVKPELSWGSSVVHFFTLIYQVWDNELNSPPTLYQELCIQELLLGVPLIENQQMTIIQSKLIKVWIDLLYTHLHTLDYHVKVSIVLSFCWYSWVYGFSKAHNHSSP